MTVQTDLLIEIEAFLATRQGMAETTFGKLAVNDGKFVRRLRDGCNMTLATVERVRRFMKAQPQVPAASSLASPKSKPKRQRRSPEETPSSSAEAA